MFCHCFVQKCLHSSDWYELRWVSYNNEVGNQILFFLLAGPNTKQTWNSTCSHYKITTSGNSWCLTTAPVKPTNPCECNQKKPLLHSQISYMNVMKGSYFFANKGWTFANFQTLIPLQFFMNVSVSFNKHQRSGRTGWFSRNKKNCARPWLWETPKTSHPSCDMRAPSRGFEKKQDWAPSISRIHCNENLGLATKNTPSNDAKMKPSLFNHGGFHQI